MAKAKPTKPSRTGSKTEAQKSENANHTTTMKTSEIRDLIEFISTTGLNEVNIETRELKLHVKRKPDQKILKAATPVVTAPAPVAPAPATQVAQSSPAPKVGPATEVPAGKNTVDIKSPMIGTFYRSSNPETPPFVSVGDKVIKGQTLCIIEAMKLFNEIESEVSGTVVKILVDNATPVEYDQVLFVVEPD
jgi:acetyl-CoA carboxylase biotin carboxyl carrier protein